MVAKRWSVFVFSVLLGFGGLAKGEPGFEPLVSGDDPSQFDLIGIGPETIRIADGVVMISGKKNGYFATKKSYKNYTLKFDWMYERPEGLAKGAVFQGNSGLLVHITGPHKVWPKCTEVQLFNPDAGNIFAIQGATFKGKKDPVAQKQAIKPAGEWNSEEVTCRDGVITCKINDIEVAKGSGADPDSGTIGWQSEGSKIQFRKIEIKVIE